MRVFFVVLFFISSVGCFADEPNAKFEKLIHNLYVKYYSKPISPQEWKQFVKDIKDEKYVVRRGDTLWSMSKVFFADGMFWSKIWALNAELTNPHLISIGKELRFLVGTEEEPPVLVITGEEGEPAPGQGLAGAKQATGGGQSNPGEAIIAPARQTGVNPLLRVLPASFVESNDAYLFSQKDFHADLRPKPTPDPGLQILDFLSEKRIEGDGEVIGILGLENTALITQEVLLQMNTDVAVGSTLYAISNEIEVESSDFDGYNYEYVSQLKVRELTPDGFVRAQVVSSYGSLSPKDLIIKNPPGRVKVDLSRSAKTGDWRIFAGTKSEDRKLFSIYEIVFIDAGSDKGLSLGNIVEVFQKIELPDEDPVYAPHPKAIVQIVQVLENVSAGIIIRNSMPVYINDYLTRFEED